MPSLPVSAQPSSPRFRRRAKRLAALLGPLLFSALITAWADNVTPVTTEQSPSPQDSVNTAYGLIGKWMIAPDSQIARFQGYEVGERALREPINIVLLDKVARTPQEAVARLISAMKAAGYPARNGRPGSSYKSMIGAQLYPAQPTDSKEAFSDGAWWRSNNRGWLFGPAPVAGGYLWTGSFCREDYQVISAIHQAYQSFETARDDLATRLTAAGTFRQLTTLNLENALNTPTLTTDDHDGQAALLVAESGTR